MCRRRFCCTGSGTYGPDTPYLSYQLFDVQRSAHAQGLEVGAYDVVIAANVLHATQNIRQTLQHAKSLLKGRGVLLLNEITGGSLFTHLTFGLLEGWWRYEDEALRVVGSPALSGQRWEQLLQAGGFEAIGFPAAAVQALGQQIIAARSDGLYRQERAPLAPRGVPQPLLVPPQPRKTPASERIVAGATPTGERSGPPLAPSLQRQSTHGITERASFASSATDQPEAVRQAVREVTAQVLNMEDRRLKDDTNFADLGVDSILAVTFIRNINEQFALRLPTTAIFDYHTIEKLTQHVLRHVRDAVGVPTAAARTGASGITDSDSIKRQARSSSDAYSATVTTGARPAMAPIARPARFGRLPHLSRSRSAVAGEADMAMSLSTQGLVQRIAIDGPGSIADLQVIEELPIPLDSGEVRIAVHAASLNFADLLCVKGLYPNMPSYPFTPGMEVSGRVLEVGPGVSSIKVGMRVIATTAPRFGGHATLVTCHEGQVFAMPDNLSYEDGCALPVVAWTMIDAFRKAALRPGEKILIQTAAGGTGLIAVQLAQYYGAEIYATAGSQEKLDYLHSLGVKNVLNYTQYDFEDWISRLTLKQGVDVVINTLPGEALQKGLNCLGAGGRYIEIAMTALRSARSIDLSALNDNQIFYSVDLFRLMRKWPEVLTEYRREMLELVERGVIHATIGAVFPFDEIKQAYRQLEDRRNIGKVVLRMPQADSHVVATGPSAERIDGMSKTIRAPIAIIGMSGRYSGTEDVQELWGKLAQGKELMEEARRWDLSKAYSSAQISDGCRRGGFLASIDQFDPMFFNISGLEATYMDPHQRLFLEEAWSSLEDSGYVGASVDGSRCGVYVGFNGSDYGNVGSNESLPAQMMWGGAASVLSSRIAYYLNLKGPAVTIDTACSSSMVAIHLASQALRNEEIDLAMAGGVFVQSTPALYVMGTKAGMLSASGHCRPFDDAADGFLPGEGAGVLVLKRLSDALRDGDGVRAVILGSGINQDGATNGITAPSALSQEQLEREVYERYGIDPEGIQMVEAHGTGTKLGDPIEFQALSKAFRCYTQKRHYCAIGSIKSNIGHTTARQQVWRVLSSAYCRCGSIGKICRRH